MSDPLVNYPKNIRDKLANNPIIIDAIRNCRERGKTKEETLKLIGAPYEVVDKVYSEKTKHDTGRRHTEDD